MQTKAHSDEVKAALDAARGQIAWIRENPVGIEIKGDHRHRIPAQLFDLAIEHGPGIAHLISANKLVVIRSSQLSRSAREVKAPTWTISGLARG
jgi:hypothetical protein